VLGLKQPSQSTVSDTLGTTNNTSGLKQPPSVWQITAQMFAETKKTMLKKDLPTMSKSSPACDVKTAGLPKDVDKAYENNNYFLMMRMTIKGTKDLIQQDRRQLS